MLFTVIEWSAYNIQTVMIGRVGVKAQAAEIIGLQMNMLTAGLSLGICLCACTLVGNKIGEGDV